MVVWHEGWRVRTELESIGGLSVLFRAIRMVGRRVMRRVSDQTTGTKNVSKPGCK